MRRVRLRSGTTHFDDVFYGYEAGVGPAFADDRAELVALMSATASQGGSAPASPTAVN